MAEVRRAETPLMKQYFRIKDENPGAILLFRMGDFYETFGEDARNVAPILGITLTKRSNGKATHVALTGFPYHSLDTYLPKLIRAGLRVAICEQVEDPKQTKKLVKRDVVEVVSPGVSLREHLLEPGVPTYLTALSVSSEGIAGVATLDASTGEFTVGQVPIDLLSDTIDAISPSELVVEKGSAIHLPARVTKGVVVTEQDAWVFTHDYAHESLTAHFGTHSLKGFGVEEMPMAIIAAGAAMHYVKESQRMAPTYITSITRLDNSDYMILDPQTRRNLELVTSTATHSSEDSLLAILDVTRTPMGARLLRKWMLNPLKNAHRIVGRNEAVDAVYQNVETRRDIQLLLDEVGDMERLCTRVSVNRASPRDIVQLKRSLAQLPTIKSATEDLTSENWSRAKQRISIEAELVSSIEAALMDEPPATMAKGGIIRDGFHPELDELRSINRSGKEWIAKLQKEESERTGITSLKIGFNRVFGYYLEVTNAHKDRVPDDYIRKQTLVNAERYITPALKEYEEKVLSAEEKIVGLEQELFQTICSSIADKTESILANAAAVAEIDTYCSLAEVAAANNYVRPVVDDSSVLDIEKGRHPVVEWRLPVGESFIPNSVHIDPSDGQILIVTGPNMAGKSVVLRQTGLIVLMAQIGSFVPASRARIGVVDRIFTRVGASDNLAEGESTFLVEMNETANILNNATNRSLILFDEVGRGTSTFDGMSIAWSLVEYLHETPAVAAKTIFATHYHELNELAENLPRVRNYRVLVEEHEGKVIFLRKLVAGGADHSFGIEVARMAGLPAGVIDRANEILAVLEDQQLVVIAGTEAGDGSASSLPTIVQPTIPKAIAKQSSQSDDVSERLRTQISLFGQDPVLEDLRSILENLDPDKMTPVEALLQLVDMQKRLKTKG